MFDSSIILQALDYLGTLAFGLSGAMVTVRKQTDIFGVVVLATLTGIGGGILRDVLAREVSILLPEQVYASASIVGATAFWFTIKGGLRPEIAAPIAAALVIAIRLVSRSFHWQLPRPADGDARPGGPRD